MSTHQDVTQLLPWYVNGTLNEREMAAVEAHLEGCEDCRDTMARDVQEARWMHAGGDEARIAGLCAHRGREFDSLRRRLGRPSVPVPAAPPRWLPALAALFVIALAPQAVWLSRGEPTLYELRTSNLASEAPVLQLVFREGTSQEDIDLLIRASGTLLGTRTGHGIYRIALATDDPHAQLERIRAHPAVRWAEIEL